MKSRSFAVAFASMMVGMVVLSGCPPKKKLAIEEKKPEVVKPGEDQKTEVPEKKDIEINQDWTEIPALEMVHYGYDTTNLDDAARSTLKKNVGIIKKLPKSVTVRVEGHCDDRGTVEYNIALGQRRANAVRSYYVTAGILKNRLETISFGEERPLCKEETEDCWAKNRRGMTKVKNAQPLIIKPSDLE